MKKILELTKTKWRTIHLKKAFGNQEDPLHKSFNPYLSFILAITRLIIVWIVWGWAVTFMENPIIINVSILILSFLFFYMGQDSVLIYKDRFEYCEGSFLGLMSSRRSYYFKDIQSLTLNGSLIFSTEVIEDSILSEMPVHTQLRNTFDIVLKEGTEYTYKTCMYTKELKKVMEQFKKFKE